MILDEFPPLPTNWIYFDVTDSFYYVSFVKNENDYLRNFFFQFGENKTFDEAEDFCESRNAHLTSVLSKDEGDFLASMVFEELKLLKKPNSLELRSIFSCIHTVILIELKTRDFLFLLIQNSFLTQSLKYSGKGMAKFYIMD